MSNAMKDDINPVRETRRERGIGLK